MKNIGLKLKDKREENGLSMKKVIVFILTFILFIPIVNGKNINDLYGELNALESQKNLYSYLNSEDIKSLSNNGLDIQIIIDSLNDEINELDKEITSKEEFINSLKEEIDNVMVYNQVSQGENIYLEIYLLLKHIQIWYIDI